MTHIMLSLPLGSSHLLPRLLGLRGHPLGRTPARPATPRRRARACGSGALSAASAQQPRPWNGAEYEESKSSCRHKPVLRAVSRHPLPIAAHQSSSGFRVQAHRHASADVLLSAAMRQRASLSPGRPNKDEDWLTMACRSTRNLHDSTRCRKLARQPKALRAKMV